MTKQRRGSMFQLGNRDTNESHITAVLDSYRIAYVKQPIGAGFDLLVMVAPMECWEVKNPEHKWTLTKSEQETKDYCKRNRITYRVIEYADQAVDALAARKPAVNVHERVIKQRVAVES